MDMSSEFINVYISKMKATIDDFLTKNLILDTQLTIAGLQIEELITQKTQLEETLSKLEQKSNKIKKTEVDTF